jgi:hypothetical protein
LAIRSGKIAIVSTVVATFLLSGSALADSFLAAVDNGQITDVQITNAQATNPPVPTNVRLSVTCSVGNADAIDSVIASAQTPQQAARLFAKIMSPAIGQGIANAVQQALAQTANRSTVNPPTATTQIQGWQDLIAQNGLAVELNWPSPGLATAGNLPVSLLQARSGAVGSGALLAVSVSGTF